MVPPDSTFPAGSQLVVTREDHGHSVVLAVAGEIDLLTAPDLQRELSRALEDRPSVLVVDLSRVEFLASQGLAALVGAHRDAGESTQLRLVAEGNATLRPLQLTGLDEQMPVYSSCEDALFPHGGRLDESDPRTS